MKEYVKDYNELCIKIGAAKAPTHYQTDISNMFGYVTLYITAKISESHIITWKTTTGIDRDDKRFFHKSFWGTDINTDEIDKELKKVNTKLIDKYAKPLAATEGYYDE